MSSFRVGALVRALLVLLSLGTVVSLATSQAEARAGRGRSIGRSSGSGSRQSTSPSNQQPSSNYANRNAAPGQPNGTPPGRGGFMRGLAGGVAGGFLGSMLFSSLGNAAGGVGGVGGVGGAGGGGIGFLEIIIFAGLAYFGYRWWKNRQLQSAVAYRDTSAASSNYGTSSFRSESPNVAKFPSPVADAIDTDEASDTFFRIQAAWTRRDLSTVRDLLVLDMQETLQKDLEELKTARQVNRLENISVRNVEVVNSWQEVNDMHSTVRLTANMLDYTVDESSGRVVTGSDSLPVKFEEDWTFVKAGSADGWRLTGIQQV